MTGNGDELDARLGARIRVEREARGWSLTDLSDRAGVSRAMINKIERAESSPTASLLGRLSGAFGLTLSALLARAEDDGRRRLLRAEEQRSWRDPATGYVRRLVAPPPGSDMPLELVHIDLPAGARVPFPASAYAFTRHIIHVLTNELTFTEGDIEHRLAAGDSLELGPPADCVFENRGDRPCTYLVLILQP
ncbi:helix-turn-helix domain-containing protein [Nitrospirillum viridazoti]|uniref:LacI family transcriptional regulator n=1 Tax=Nitrospirillum viridazoti CBAmc TaxID=1441467 RepID=A0A248K015_9PROT|nr:XRE family transcriptional regulator [Nitrospirillum amazonense]ASG24150.1 LacI family transcriptional regulator [Nitrospirillum amazonense CBAmc]TWB40860.1 XRE family transcriptional regulator [Nitrospirillum amazonense]